eukprot:scaffold156859_cov40-Prasinocladus_malaysianus.AAC.1
MRLDKKAFSAVSVGLYRNIQLAASRRSCQENAISKIPPFKTGRSIPRFLPQNGYILSTFSASMQA